MRAFPLDQTRSTRRAVVVAWALGEGMKQLQHLEGAFIWAIHIFF